MKTITVFFLPMILVFTVHGAFAQDEFYNNSSNQKETVDTIEQTSMAENEEATTYMTEEDYVQQNIDHQKTYTEEEIESETEKQRRREANAVFLGELFVDVFINVAFIVAAFW